MVKLKVKAKAEWSQMHRDIARNAVQYALDFYELDEKVHVRLVGADGQHDGFMVDATNKFVIWIFPQTAIRKLLETVFHEMTHVNQAVDGWFLSGDEDTACWKGEMVPYDENTDYWTAPWEVEARNMGRTLRKAYTGV